MKKLLSLWFNGFTAFSVKPLRVATIVGMLFAAAGFLYLVYTLVNRFINPNVPIGWSSMMAVLLVVGGCILFMLGLIGEYIGRIYISLNNSPQFVIKKVTGELKMKSIRIVRQDVFRFLENTSYSYDLIFADPPYQMEGIETIPDKVLTNNHLNKGGILIVEHGEKTSFEGHPNFTEHRHYGSVHFSFFENAGD